MAKKNIKVTICCGTACYLLGGAQLLELKDSLPQEIKDRVEIETTHCLGYCKEESFKGKAPFVCIDGAVVCQATPSEVARRIAARLEAE